MSDPHVELALRACDGDEVAFAALLRSLAGSIELIVRDFFLHGADRDDLWQEARIGLLQATVSFDPARGVLFKTFAQGVVRRRLIDAMMAANRGKHRPLSESDRLERLVRGADGEDTELGELLDGGGDPLDLVLAHEEVRELIALVAGLSDMERRAVIGRALGLSYEEIGPPKVVDNAVQRAWKKMRAARAA